MSQPDMRDEGKPPLPSILKPIAVERVHTLRLQCCQSSFRGSTSVRAGLRTEIVEPFYWQLGGQYRHDAERRRPAAFPRSVEAELYHLRRMREHRGGMKGGDGVNRAALAAGEDGSHRTDLGMVVPACT